MALADILRDITARLNFAGDDGARDDLLRQIGELDSDTEPADGTMFASAETAGTTDDDVVDGANA